ncbi:MAG: anhydro-N-acetylmuramic acid kinase [Acidobacteria bacterium]|nr:anhydro-N-acetylmuramic acid kinase [Acidobacteriota bacterium]
MRVAGIMSGTSLDGIDVAIVDITGRSWTKRVETVALGSAPYPRKLREELLAVSNCETHTAAISRLNFRLGELYAGALAAVCRRARLPLESVKLVGCHGQTIYHESGRNTLQIGEGAVLAERTGLPVVCDFRPRDIAAGGRGAPLVPYADYLLLRDRRRGRTALNIGGIANLTLIPPGAAPEEVIAFDTGPGNMVIDALVSHYTAGKRRFDRDGRIASRGAADPDLLDVLLANRYFQAPPPKTAGREQYGREFAGLLLSTGLPLPDLIATATAFTAAAVAAGHRLVRPEASDWDLIVSGGGAHNRQLMAYLAAFLPELSVRTSAEFGIDIDGKEAIAFAVLAHETWHGRPSNLPSATGASRAVVLGKIILGEQPAPPLRSSV